MPGVGRVPFREITPSELQRKGDLNLCFNCDEKYHKGHRCSKTSQLLLLLTDEESPDEQHSPSSDNTLDLSSSPPTSDNPLLPSISYLALSGGPIPTAIRLTAQVKGLSVQVLLDGGNTHNFIHPRAVQFLKVPVDSSSNFQVMVGNGSLLKCHGVVRQLPLTIQGFTFSTDFYVIDFHGADLVLSVVWLATLGPTVTDYAKRLFQFDSNGETIRWIGDPVQSVEEVQFTSLRRLTETHSVSGFFRLELLSMAESSSPALPYDLTELLDSYSDLFATATVLPPPRPQDHRIPLIPGSAPVKVRPYCYPHFQKTEIERLVYEMLQAGIIRPSSSSYSSPVLLVRKKDGAWRFCVDYRALNSVTVNDMFPIPTIESFLMNSMELAFSLNLIYWLDIIR